MCLVRSCQDFTCDSVKCPKRGILFWKPNTVLSFSTNLSLTFCCVSLFSFSCLSFNFCAEKNYTQFDCVDINGSACKVTKCEKVQRKSLVRHSTKLHKCSQFGTLATFGANVKMFNFDIEHKVISEYEYNWCDIKKKFDVFAT